MQKIIVILILQVIFSAINYNKTSSKTVKLLIRIFM